MMGRASQRCAAGSGHERRLYWTMHAVLGLILSVEIDIENSQRSTRHLDKQAFTLFFTPRPRN